MNFFKRLSMRERKMPGIFRKKNVGFKRLIETDHQPRLKYGSKLEKSSFEDGRIHPVLEALFQFMFVYGKISVYEDIQLDQKEKRTKKEMVRNLKKGKMTLLDCNCISTKIVLAVMRNYIKHLQKTPFHSKSFSQWKQIAAELPRQSDSEMSKKSKTMDLVQRAKMLLIGYSLPATTFLQNFFLALHSICSKSPNFSVAVFRLAEYFADIMIVKRVKSLQMQLELESIMRFFITEAPSLFPDSSLCFSSSFPLYNLHSIDLCSEANENFAFEDDMKFGTITKI